MRLAAVAVLALLAVLAPSRVAAASSGAVTRPRAEVERPAALRHFFEALARLEASRQSKVRVLQLGDSHTAGEHLSAAVRRALQLRFGDGGRGAVPFGQPGAPYAGDGVRAGVSGEWHVERARRPGPAHGDGHFGLGGLAVAATSRGARAWLESEVPAERIELAYLEQPGGGRFEARVGGSSRAHRAARAASPRSAWLALDAAEGARALEVRLEGDGAVRLLSATLERDRPGLVYDALGINGARASVLLEWNEAHLAEQLAHRAFDLVVLAYGTNESGERAGPAAWQRQLGAVLARLRRSAPRTACLILGPPDRAVAIGAGAAASWASLPALRQVVAAQRRAAEAAGCAYFSQLDAMGGEGSMAAWAQESPPRATRDRVHLTREGYTQLGEAFASALIEAYEQWRRDEGGAPACGTLLGERMPAAP